MSLSPRDMDFIEARHAAAREIALALGVPPMLLAIPGDNTYSNYQEATRAFWRQTVLPLANRIASGQTSWLATPQGLTIKIDLDQVEALSGERADLWSRLNATAFLTPNEKRAAAGYDPLTNGTAIRNKYDPGQLRNPAGSGRPSGRWTKRPTGAPASAIPSQGEASESSGDESDPPTDPDPSFQDLVDPSQEAYDGGDADEAAEDENEDGDPNLIPVGRTGGGGGPARGGGGGRNPPGRGHNNPPSPLQPSTSTPPRNRSTRNTTFKHTGSIGFCDRMKTSSRRPKSMGESS